MHLRELVSNYSHFLFGGTPRSYGLVEVRQGFAIEKGTYVGKKEVVEPD